MAAIKKPMLQGPDELKKNGNPMISNEHKPTEIPSMNQLPNVSVDNSQAELIVPQPVLAAPETNALNAGGARQEQVNMDLLKEIENTDWQEEVDKLQLFSQVSTVYLKLI